MIHYSENNQSQFISEQHGKLYEKSEVVTHAKLCEENIRLEIMHELVKVFLTDR